MTEKTKNMGFAEWFIKSIRMKHPDGIIQLFIIFSFPIFNTVVFLINYYWGYKPEIEFGMIERRFEKHEEKRKQYVIYHQTFADWFKEQMLAKPDFKIAFYMLFIPILSWFIIFSLFMEYLTDRKSYRYKILPNKQLKRVRLP